MLSSQTGTPGELPRAAAYTRRNTPIFVVTLAQHELDYVNSTVGDRSVESWKKGVRRAGVVEVVHPHLGPVDRAVDPA